MKKQRRPSLSISRIAAAVAKRLGPPNKHDMHRGTVESRHIACFLCVEAGWSLTQIGMWLQRHHTTVLAGYRKIKARLDDPDTVALLAEIRQSAASTDALPAVPRVPRKPPGSDHCDEKPVRFHEEDLTKLADLIAARIHRGAA